MRWNCDPFWTGAALVLLLAAMGLGAWLAARWRSFKTRRRQARAQRGEEKAPGVLRRLGYEVSESQVRRTIDIRVDGKPRAAEVVADILAAKGGRQYVVEVKTGDEATDPVQPQTRRQLLEYALAFGPCRVLLLDMEREEPRLVEFPALDGRPVRPAQGLWKWLLLALLVGMLAGIGIGARAIALWPF